MRIVDAHIHLWSQGQPRSAHRQAPYSPEQALHDMREAGVDAAVITPPGWAPNADAYAIEAAARYPDQFAVMGGLPLERTECERQLARWNSGGMAGLRYIFNEPRHADWLASEELDWFWSGAAARQIPVALAVARYLPLVSKVARRHPDLRLLIDHLGVPMDARGPAAFAHLDELLALSRHPNVCVKATAIPTFADDAYPYPALHATLWKILDAFGRERVCWGSDITKLPCSWGQCVSLFTEELGLSSSDLEWIMGDALCKWIHWDHPPG